MGIVLDAERTAEVDASPTLFLAAVILIWHSTMHRVYLQHHLRPAGQRVYENVQTSRERPCTLVKPGMKNSPPSSSVFAPCLSAKFNTFSDHFHRSTRTYWGQRADTFVSSKENRTAHLSADGVSDQPAIPQTRSSPAGGRYCALVRGTKLLFRGPFPPGGTPGLKVAQSPL